jgi:hypothetical protein
MPHPISATLARLSDRIASAPGALRRAAFMVRRGLEVFPEILHRSEIDSDATTARFSFYVNGERFRVTVERDVTPKNS